MIHERKKKTKKHQSNITQLKYRRGKDVDIVDVLKPLWTLSIFAHIEKIINTEYKHQEFVLVGKGYE